MTDQLLFGIRIQATGDVSPATRPAKAELDAVGASARGAKEELEGVGRSSRTSKTELEGAGGAARRAKTELEGAASAGRAVETANRGAAEGARAHGAAARSAAGEAVRQAEAQRNQAVAAARAAGDTARLSESTRSYSAAAVVATSESRRLAEAQGNTTAQAGRLGEMLRSLGAVLGLRRALTAGDDYEILQSRIQGATRATGDYAAVSAELNAVSAETGTALAGNVALFQRAISASKELGATNDQLLRFTENIAKLGVLSGATPDALNDGTRQLAQSLSSEIVRAEEFNSVLESIPEVAIAIADALGVSVGQLRQMMLDGRLLSRDVFAAILSQSAEIDERFAGFNRSIKAAGQAAANAFGQSTGELGQWAGALQLVANTLDLAADNMDLLVVAGAGLALVFGARAAQSYFGPLVSGATASAASLLRLWTAVGSGNAVLLSSRAAIEGSAAAKLQYAQASQAAAQAELQQAQAALRSAETAAAEAQSRLSLAAVSNGYMAAEARLATAKETLTAATARVAAAETAQAMATQHASVAQEAHSAAMARGTLAARAYAAAGTVLATAWRGAMALLGGPVGIALTAATIGLMALSGGQSEAERAADAHTEAMRRLEAVLQDVATLSQQQRIELQAKLTLDERDTRAQIEKQLDEIQLWLPPILFKIGLSDDDGLLALEPLADDAMRSAEGLQRLVDALAALAAEPGASEEVLDIYQAVLDLTKGLTDNRQRLAENAEGQRKLGETAVQTASDFALLHAEVIAFNRAITDGIAPIRTRAQALAEQSAALAKGDLAGYEAIVARQAAEEKAAAAAKKALEETKLQGREAAEAYRLFYDQALSNEKVAQANTDAAAKLRKEQGELAKGLGQTQTEAERLAEQQQQLAVSSLQAADAERLRYEATIKGTAAAQALETELDIWHELVAAKLVPAELDLADALDLINESTDARIVKIRDSIRAAGEWREKTEAVTKAEEAASEAEKRLAEERQELLERPFKNALDGIQQSFVDFFQTLYSGGVDSFESLAQAAKGIFTRLAAEITTLLVFNPSLLSGGTAGSLLSAILPGSGAYGGGAASGGGLFGSLLSAAGSAGSWISGGWDSAMSWLGLGAKPMTGAGGYLTGGGVTSSGAGMMTGGFGIGDALGGLGIGMTAGSLLSMLGYGKSSTGTTMGGAVGGLAGAAIGSVIPGVGTILGGIIGGLGGGLLGGLFGKRPSNNTAGLEINFGSGNAQRWDDKPSEDNVNLTNWVGQQLTQFNSILEAALGKKSDIQLSWWLGDRDGVWLQNSSAAGYPRQSFGGKSEESVQALTRTAAELMVDSLKNVDATVAGMIKKSLDLRKSMEEVGKDIEVIAMAYPDLIPSEEELSGAAAAMKEINDRWDEWAKRARELGIAEQRIADGRAAEIEALKEGVLKGWDQQILELTDPLGAALAELEEWRDQAIADATAIGTGMTKVEELYGLKRQQILEQYLGQANDSIQKILDDMKYGTSGGVAVGERLTGLRATVQAAGAQALAGDAAARQRVIDLAPELLQLSQQANAGSADFYVDRDFVQRLLEQLQVQAPGYADGTPSAARGLARVGERGPEWLLMRGGEQVISNAASRGWSFAGANDDGGLMRQMLGHLAGIEEGVAALARAQQRANRRLDLLEARLARQANVQQAA